MFFFSLKTVIETRINYKALLRIKKRWNQDGLQRQGVLKDFTKVSTEATFKGGKREDLWNHRSHNLNLMIKSWSKSSKEKETGNGQYSFNVGKLSLTDLISLYDRLPMIHSMAELKRENDLYLDFDKSFCKTLPS